jgi:iron complex outermembrane receptor protein
VTQSLSDEGAVHATGIRDGNRLPSVPKFQMALSATYQHPITPTYWGYVTGNYQHVGDRYTQLVDQEPGTGVIPLQNVPGALGFTIGGPLTQNTFTFDPLLPAYDLINSGWASATVGTSRSTSTTSPTSRRCRSTANGDSGARG